MREALSYNTPIRNSLSMIPDTLLHHHRPQYYHGLHALMIITIMISIPGERQEVVFSCLSYFPLCEFR